MKRDSVQIGAAIPGAVESLKRTDILPLKQLFAVNDKSPYYNETAKANVFYTSAWALIHMLTSARSTVRNSLSSSERWLPVRVRKVPLSDLSVNLSLQLNGIFGSTSSMDSYRLSLCPDLPTFETLPATLGQ